LVSMVIAGSVGIYFLSLLASGLKLKEFARR